MKPNFQPVPYPVFWTSDFPPARSAAAARDATAPSSGTPRSAAATHSAASRTLEHIAFSAREVNGWTGPTAVFFLNVAGHETRTGGSYAATMAVRKSNAVRTIFEKGADDVRIAGKCFGRGLILVDVSGVVGGSIHGLNAPAAVFFNAAGEVARAIDPGTNMTEAAILEGMVAAYEPGSLDAKLSVGRDAIQVVRLHNGLRTQLDAKHAALRYADPAAHPTILLEIDGLKTEIARLDGVIAGFEAQLVPQEPPSAPGR